MRTKKEVTLSLNPETIDRLTRIAGGKRHRGAFIEEIVDLLDRGKLNLVLDQIGDVLAFTKERD
jgi:hypothetical protein